MQDENFCIIVAECSDGEEPFSLSQGRYKNLKEAIQDFKNTESLEVPLFHIPLDTHDPAIRAFAALMELAIEAQDGALGTSLEQMLLQIFIAGRNSAFGKK